jgi:uncharacterized membrane protein
MRPKGGGGRRGARGGVVAWFALLMAVLMLPLLVLSVDIARLMYVRTHLQAAADAACEAAAQALNVPYFQETGLSVIDAGRAGRFAAREFAGSVQEANIVEDDPALTGLTLLAPRTVACTATAVVHPIIPITPPMKPVVYTTSEMRTGR